MALEALCHRASETRLNESGSIGAYNKRCYRARVGQVVYVRSLGASRVPYIALLMRIRNGTANMRWYYRTEDLPAGTIMPYEPAPTELFLSDTCDDNPIDLIIGPCDVASKENSTGYFCRASFTGGAISAFTVATREHSLALDLESEPQAQKRSCNN